ncbi:hypothetical protein TrLO_g3179 [Triparma laevis f. longispina]|uniref:Tyrosine-protein kinase ephrin type A/B receptor-like domain-containing protein n=1 Tax=Triparma laevis f. longispina TaxID=1714387 RepID=A0A9W7F7W7_9STRA|nr:hypothetical protein TrLO_g3179 [Triparma laevis f. longispina]
MNMRVTSIQKNHLSHQNHITHTANIYELNSNTPPNSTTLSPTFCLLRTCSAPSSCPAGRYTLLVSPIVCKGCDAGEFSSEGSSSCSSCSAGKYSEAGSGACSDCSAGKHIIEGATTGVESSICTDCANGKSSPAGSSVCTTCDAGKYSYPAGTYSNNPNGATTCALCAKGKYAGAALAGESRAAAYEYCGPGFYADQTSHTCKECEVNSYSVGGVNECNVCPSGTNNAVASTSCSPCPPGKIPTGTSCDQCEKGKYGVFGATSCAPCKGDGQYADEVGLPACKTALTGTKPTSDLQDIENCSPETFSVGGKTECLQCESGKLSTEGAVGSQCEPGQVPVNNACEKCEKGKHAKFGLTACLPYDGQGEPARAIVSCCRGKKRGDDEDNVNLTADGSLATNPNRSSRGLSRAEKAVKKAQGMMNTISEVQPYIMFSRPEFPTDLLRFHQWFLFMTFLVLPSVCTKIFSTFACRDFDGDYGSYLKVDYSIDCDLDDHKWYIMYAGGCCMVLFPIGVPLMYFFYFEILETGRKLVLTGGLIFLRPGTRMQVVFLVMLSALMIKANIDAGETSENQGVYDVVLIAFHGAVVDGADAVEEGADSGKGAPDKKNKYRTAKTTVKNKVDGGRPNSSFDAFKHSGLKAGGGGGGGPKRKKKNIGVGAPIRKSVIPIPMGELEDAPIGPPKALPPPAKEEEDDDDDDGDDIGPPSSPPPKMTYTKDDRGVGLDEKTFNTPPPQKEKKTL